MPDRGKGAGSKIRENALVINKGPFLESCVDKSLMNFKIRTILRSDLK